MNLHEYQAKRLFAEHGVPIPNGDIASTPVEAREIARELGGKVVVKSQVLIGGRGKAGGIKLANNPNEAEAAAGQILGMNIKGFQVHKVLIDEQSPGGIDQEIYLAVLIDRAKRRAMVMASAEGGMDIEEVNERTPEKIFRAYIEPALGVRSYQTTYLASAMDLPRELWRDFHKIVVGLYSCFRANDASLTEINPLVITGSGKLMALDGKMSIDDNGLFRQPKLAEMRDVDEETAAEKEARLNGINLIQLDGNIGCMVNGAGLAMATMDVVKKFGEEHNCAPANFLDIGGGANAEKVAKALRIILQDPNVKSILFNIFGGITRCDEVAKGILEALKQVPTDVPMVARLVGTNEEEGQKILAEANFPSATSLSDAAQQAVALAKGA